MIDQNTFNLYHLLNLDLFEDLAQLESYMNNTLHYHMNFRYVDTYHRHREPLFHGEYLIGMDYSLDSVFRQRYIAQNCDNDLQKRFYVEFLEQLSQIYELEKICKYNEYTFRSILQIYLNYESFGCFNQLYLLMKWGAHPYFRQCIKASLSSWKSKLCTLPSHELQPLYSNSLVNLQFWSLQYVNSQFLESRQILMNWFEVFAHSSLFQLYLTIIKFIQKCEHELHLPIDQIGCFFPNYSIVLIYKKQNLYTTLQTMFTLQNGESSKEKETVRTQVWSTDGLLEVHKKIIQFEDLLRTPKYRLLLSMDTRLGFIVSNTWQFYKQIRFKKILVRLFIGISTLAGAFYILHQQSANAMVSNPRIVISMSSNDLVDQAGTYTDIQRLQVHSKTSITATYQKYERAHNLPMKSWQVLEVPKTSTPVILLDPPIHEFLDLNRAQEVRNATDFATHYSSRLIQEGYISAHGVWTQKGLDILSQYELACDERLLVQSNPDTKNRKLLEGFKNLDNPEVSLLTEIQQKREIPVNQTNQTGKWLITRKIIGTIDAWSRDLKTYKLNENLADYQFQSAESTFDCWYRFSQKANDLAKMYSIQGSNLDMHTLQYCTEDLIRCVSYVGNVLDEHPGVQLQPLIRQTVDQIQTNINKSISDNEYIKLVRQNNFHNPHQPFGQSLRSVIGQKVRRSNTL